jgi:hypothetical protein
MMAFTEDVNFVAQLRDDIIARNSSTQKLLALISQYGGDSALAQSVIDADTQLQNLMLAYAGNVLKVTVATPVAMPSTLQSA